MRLILGTHNHCVNTNLLTLEDYNDKSLQTIYIIHNNSIVCLEPDELEAMLFPAPLRRPDDNEDAWTEEHKDPVLYFWHLENVPNRINLEKSAVRIHGLELFVDREEMIYLFRERYNTIALGVPRRDYEEEEAEEDAPIGASSFIRTGLGRRRDPPQLPDLNPPLTENVYNCYPISRIDLLRDFKIIDINTTDRRITDRFVKEETEIDKNGNVRKKPIPLEQRDWGTEISIPDEKIVQAIQISQRDNRPIKIMKDENSFPIIIHPDAIPFLWRNFQTGKIRLIFREGMYYPMEKNVLPLSFPKSTMRGGNDFSVVHPSGVQEHITSSPTEMKEWLIRNANIRGMDRIIREGSSHIDFRNTQLRDRTITSVAPVSLYSLPKDVLSHVSSFLPPSDSLLSVIPNAPPERLIPFISHYLVVKEIYRNEDFEFPTEFPPPKIMSQNKIHHLMRNNWKLDKTSVLMVFGEPYGDNFPSNEDLYLILVKLHLLGKIKNCIAVEFVSSRESRRIADGSIPLYLEAMQRLDNPILTMFFLWLVKNENRLPHFIYPDWCLERAMGDGNVSTVEAILRSERYSLERITIPLQYIPLFLHLGLGDTREVIESVEMFQDIRFDGLPYPEYMYERWNRDDFVTQMVRTFLLASEELFDNMELKYTERFEIEKLSFEEFLDSFGRIRLNIDKPINLIDNDKPNNLINKLFDIDFLRRARMYYIKCMIRQYERRIREWRGEHPELEQMNMGKRTIFYREFIINLIASTQYLPEEEDIKKIMKKLETIASNHYLDSFLNRQKYLLREAMMQAGLIYVPVETDVQEMLVILGQASIKQRNDVIEYGLNSIRGATMQRSPQSYIPFKAINMLTEPSNIFLILSEITYGSPELIELHLPLHEGVELLEERIQEIRERVDFDWSRDIYNRAEGLLGLLRDINTFERLQEVRRQVETYDVDVDARVEEHQRLQREALRLRERIFEVRERVEDSLELTRLRFALRGDVHNVRTNQELENLRRRVEEFITLAQRERNMVVVPRERPPPTVEELRRRMNSLDFHDFLRDAGLEIYEALVNENTAEQLQQLRIRIDDFERLMRESSRIEWKRQVLMGLIHPTERWRRELRLPIRIIDGNVQQARNRLQERENIIMEQFRAHNGNEEIRLLMLRENELYNIRNELEDIGRFIVFEHLDLLRNMHAQVFNPNADVNMFRNAIEVNERQMDEFVRIQRAIEERNYQRVENARLRGLLDRLQQIENDDDIRDLEFQIRIHLYNPGVTDEIIDAFEARVAQAEGQDEEEEEEEPQQQEQQVDNFEQRRNRAIQRMIEALETFDIDEDRNLIVEGTDLLRRLRAVQTEEGLEEILRMMGE